MEYNFREIEKKWQDHWAKNKTFCAKNNSEKSKYYVLDMFPYPSGAGLHVGHPLGYIASDIVARYKRLKGFNVLHPMGYDSFGLPAEQYAIQTGQHPEKTTKDNIARYREQMDKIGFSFDWDREVRTSDKDFYKWTQWIFLKLFNSWYNPETDKAEPIETLLKKFQVEGKEKSWKELTEKERSDILMNYRLAYLSEAWVNWCPQLGTVLANEEVKDGVSERGGYPVERKLMPQWSLRITAYAERLLNDLEKINWSESIKESQRYWIGKSEGSSLKFKVESSKLEIEVFTTRPDTIYGVTFITLAPENDLVQQITTSEYKKQVEGYIHYAKNRSERDRQADVKKITGQFTGAYAIHPFTNEKIPIWVGDYVLAGYGTGAVMGVPAHDSRDHAFAKHFGLKIIQVVTAPTDWDIQKESFDAKEGKCTNSDFINDLEVKDAIKKIISEIEKRNLGKGKTQFRLRDAIFGRQRYWGEPIPIYYVPDEASAKSGGNGIPKAVKEEHLPLLLPEVDKFLPTETGEPPLARAKNWTYSPLLGRGAGGEAFPLETTTMPGWAGSSWYFLRYMDAKNKNEFASKDAMNYWREVDLYIGGAEHATGHLLYVRFWTKFLYDLGLIPVTEPAKKLINQGMIQGNSALIHWLVTPERLSFPIGKIPQVFVSKNKADIIIKNKDTALIKEAYQRVNPNEDLSKLEITMSDSISETGFSMRHMPIELVSVNDEINKEEIVKVFGETIFILEDDGKFICSRENEKMSKSKYNVVTPDEVCEKFGADCFRLYEMFLGPLEQSKPWNTNGITGVSNFIRKLWRLYHEDNKFSVSEEAPTKPELKSLHKTIKKIQDDIERFSFNTSVSNFMICVNELTELKCNKRTILEPLVILISPYAPHIAEELWSLLGHKESIAYAQFPEYKEEFTLENSFNYPVSFNGKTRFFRELDLALTKEQVEKEVMAMEQTQKYLEGKQPKKVIVVHSKIVNVVV